MISLHNVAKEAGTDISLMKACTYQVTLPRGSFGSLPCLGDLCSVAQERQVTDVSV